MQLKYSLRFIEVEMFLNYGISYKINGTISFL